jgi:hypothetical protein
VSVVSSARARDAPKNTSTAIITICVMDPSEFWRVTPEGGDESTPSRRSEAMKRFKGRETKSDLIVVAPTHDTRRRA